MDSKEIIKRVDDGELVTTGDGEDTEVSFLGIEGVEFTSTGMVFPTNKKLPYEKWESIVQSLRQIHEGLAWSIGDALAYGERVYGEGYAQAIVVTGLSYSALTTMKWVSSVFPHKLRKAGIPFGHYEKAAPMMRRSPEIALELLDDALELGQSVRELDIEVKKAIAELDNRELPMQPPVVKAGEAGYKATSPDGKVLHPVYDDGDRLIMEDDEGNGYNFQSPHTRANADNGERIDWLDDLLSMVLNVAQATSKDALWVAGVEAARWAVAHDFPIGEVYLRTLGG